MNIVSDVTTQCARQVLVRSGFRKTAKVKHPSQGYGNVESSSTLTYN